MRKERIDFLVASFAATFQEDEALAYLEQLRAEGAFNSGLKQVWISSENPQAKISLLMHAVMRTQERVVAWLLNNTQFDIDFGATESTNPDFEDCSPLMVACRFGNKELVEALVGRGANLMHRSANGGSVFAEIQSEAMFKILMTAAKERNCLAELFQPHVLFAFYNQNLVQCANLFGQELKKLNLSFVQYFLQLAHSELDAEESDPRINKFIADIEAHVAAGIENLKQEYVASLRSGADEQALSVMQQLLELGVTSSAEFSFLGLAVQHNREKMVAGLLNTVDDIEKAAALINSAAVFGVVALAAQQKGCLAKLFNYRFLNDFCKNHFLACMQELVNNLGENPNWKPLRDVLHMARLGFLEQGGPALDEFCEDLRARLVNAPNKPAAPVVKARQRQERSVELYQRVGIKSLERPVAEFLGSIHQAIRLLDDPDLCLDYLRELEEGFSVGHAPELDRTKVFSVELNDLLCFVPAQNYQQSEARHALQVFLVEFLAKYGLSPADFSVENNKEQGLFPNELAQLLQVALIVLAVEKNEIELRYGLNDLKIFLCILKEVASVIYDAHSEEQFSFRNPEQFISTMMNSAAEGLAAISDAVTDEFCQKFLDLYNVYKKQARFAYFTLAEFTAILGDLDHRFFVGSSELSEPRNRNQLFAASTAGPLGQADAAALSTAGRR